jgi:hypothetical protein
MAGGRGDPPQVPFTSSYPGTLPGYILLPGYLQNKKREIEGGKESCGHLVVFKGHPCDMCFIKKKNEESVFACGQWRV